MATYPRDLANLIKRRLQRDKVNPPSLDVITRLLETVYFVSLRTEEAHHITCWVTFLDPDNPDPDRPPGPRADRCSAIKLGSRIPFTVRNLAKLAPAADPWATAIAVHEDNGQLFIWGLIDQAVHMSTALVRESRPRYSPPGMFYVIAQGTAELAVYREDALIAKLRQDLLVDHEYDVLWRGPVYRRLVPSIRKLRRRVIDEVGRDLYESSYFSPGGLEEEWIGTLSRLLIGMQRYRHGGALLLSASSDGLKFKYPLQYERLYESLTRRAAHQVRASAAMHEIHDEYIEYEKKRLPMKLYFEESLARFGEQDCDAELTGCVRFISSLSRVDGLLRCDLELKFSGFGAEIVISEDPKRVFQASASDPTSGDLTPLDPSHFGMRHRSMMRFCARHPGSVGFVISQDGDIRAMTAHGSKLYVWDNIMVLHLWKEYMHRMTRRLKKKYGEDFGKTG